MGDIIAAAGLGRPAGIVFRPCHAGQCEDREMTFWHNPRKAAQVRAIAWVPVVWKDFRLTAVQPNPEKTPWLWHVEVPSGQYEVLISFWPHLGKAQREDGRTAVGEAEVRKLLEETLGRQP